MRDERMLYRMIKPLARAAAAQPVITRILMQHCRIEKRTPEFPRHLVSKGRAVTLAESLRTLAECRIIVLCLGDACIESCDHESDRLERVADKKIEFLSDR